MSNDLANYIAARNAETQAWVAEDPSNRWAGLLTDDLAHWAGYGVTTPAQLDLYLTQGTWYDMFKDAYGYRPRFDTSAWTLADYEREIEDLSRVIAANMDAEREAEAVALQRFEARVAEVIESGAGDRETALRWLWQADNEVAYDRQDLEQWVYGLGLLFTDAGRQLVVDLERVVSYTGWDEEAA